MNLPFYNLLNRVLNLLRATTTSLVCSGTLVVRQPSGATAVSGSLYHDGTNFYIVPNTGRLALGSVFLQTDGVNLLFSNSSSELKLDSSGAQIKWGSGTTFGSSNTAGLKGDSAGAPVVSATDGSSGAGFFLNAGGDCALNTAFTNNTTTFANTALARTLLAGVTYKIEGYFIAANTTGANGVKLDFNGGIATATTVSACITFTSSGSGVLLNSTITSLDEDFVYTSVIGQCRFFISGTIKVNAGGTVILRCAKNTTGGGSASLAVGSWLTFTPLVQV